jgi:hypothetical protein
VSGSRPGLCPGPVCISSLDNPGSLCIISFLKNQFTGNKVDAMTTCKTGKADGILTGGLTPFRVKKIQILFPIAPNGQVKTLRRLSYEQKS